MLGNSDTKDCCIILDQHTVVYFLTIKALKGQCHEIFCFWCFSWISFPKPQSIPLRPIQIFSKIHGDIRKSRCTPVTNFSTSFISVVDTGSKFATGANNTGWKQWEELSNCWQHEMNLRKIFIYMLTLYYPKVSKRNHKNFSDWRFFTFATGVVDTGGKPWAANVSTNFRKNSKRP
jgi:hypothetical protein